MNKDEYEYLTSFADDATILNMLSVNKKFRDEQFFKRVLERKYPLLLEFKFEDETYRKFFIKMTYYIAKLKEESGIPYIPAKGFNPVLFYRYHGDSKLLKYNIALDWAAQTGRVDLVNLMLDKGANYLDGALAIAATKGYFDIVKILVDKNIYELQSSIYGAVKGGHLNIIKFLLDKFGRDRFDFNEAAYYAILKDEEDIVKYFLDTRLISLEKAQKIAFQVGNRNILEFLEQYEIL